VDESLEELLAELEAFGKSNLRIALGPARSRGCKERPGDHL